jgi:hypothetical protein
MSGVVSMRAIRLASRQSIEAKLGPVAHVVGQPGSAAQSGSLQSTRPSPSSSTPLPHCSAGRVVDVVVVPSVVDVELDAGGAVAVVVVVAGWVADVVVASVVVLTIVVLVVAPIDVVVDSVVVVD